MKIRIREAASESDKQELAVSTYRVRKLGEAEVLEIFELCKGNPQYYEYCPPEVSIEGILADMKALPPKKSMKDKYYVGFYGEKKLVAVMDLILEYPNENTAFVGFFMVRKDLQGKGIGSQIIEEVCEYLKQQFSYVRLGYVKGNKQGENFWLKNRFEKTGQETEGEDYTVVIMQRGLS